MGTQQEQLTQELLSSLPGFTNTESYTRLRYPFMKMVLLLTDGAKFLADRRSLVSCRHARFPHWCP